MLAVLFVAAMLIAGYLFSLLTHPYSRCRVCKGGGRHLGGFYKYAQRPCRSCGGSGRRVRVGARALHIGPGK